LCLSHKKASEVWASAIYVPVCIVFWGNEMNIPEFSGSILYSGTSKIIFWGLLFKVLILCNYFLLQVISYQSLPATVSVGEPGMITADPSHSVIHIWLIYIVEQITMAQISIKVSI
jgi:hypothetical protein